MFERGINEAEARTVLQKGDVIEARADDLPYPSRLVLGFSKQRAIHIVAADNHAERETIVITVYEPDPKRWDSTLRKRRS